MTKLTRIAPVAATLAALPGLALAEGMPQLDFANPLTTYQVIWGAVIFVVLYILASRSALPRVAVVLEERAKRIAGDLETAKDAKARADAGIAAAAQATATARSEAQAAINAALSSAKEAAGARAAEETARLDQQLKEAEGQIAAARAAALEAMPTVATETAVTLITRLTGVAPEMGRLHDAIAAAMASRG
jgi:F-type H+-transporting ATPase subunit b